MAFRLMDKVLLDALREAGLADDHTRRVVIDITTGEIPVIYTEKFGDENLIKVIDAVTTVEIKKG